jgi:hypothetical protein
MRKAKLMLSMVDKTDTRHALGLNQLQRTGALPSLWIPPGTLWITRSNMGPAPCPRLRPDESLPRIPRGDKREEEAP